MTPEQLAASLDQWKRLHEAGQITQAEHDSHRSALLAEFQRSQLSGGGSLGDAVVGTQVGEGLDIGVTLGASRAQRYTLLERVGSGSFGQVWRARDEAETRTFGREREVAVKVLKSRFAQSASDLLAFQIEAKNLIELRHPHIVLVTQWVEDQLNPPRVDGGPITRFLVMEWLSGRTLDAEMAARRAQGQPWRLDEIRTLVAAMGAALEHAWNGRNARGQPFRLVHRDLKSNNIYLVDGLTPAPYPKLLDFGLAAQARDSASLATVVNKLQADHAERIGAECYVAPELADGANVAPNPAQDAYALGVLLYQLLDSQNRLPYRALRREHTARHQPPDLLVPNAPVRHEDRMLFGTEAAARQVYAALLVVIEAALAYDPAVRIGSAWQLAHRIASSLDAPRLTAHVKAPPPPAPPPAPKPPAAKPPAAKVPAVPPTWPTQPTPPTPPKAATPAPAPKGNGKWLAGGAGALGVLALAAWMYTRAVPTPSPAPAPALVTASPAPAPATVVATEAAPQRLQRGVAYRDVMKNGGLAPEFMLIPAGSNVMGSNDYDSEKPPHEVTIARAFALGRTEVTVAQYLACVAARGCDEPEWREAGSKYHHQTGSSDLYRKLGAALTGENHPIVGVSWNNAKQYVKWLSGQTGEQYRLPSESEWEYACRGGQRDHTYCGGNDADAAGWNSNNSGGKPNPVAQRPSNGNGYGLYDMSGNVWEWVEDCWVASYAGNQPANETARTSDCTEASRRVLRGGSRLSYPQYLRAAYRYGDTSVLRISLIGFRVARTVNS